LNDLSLDILNTTAKERAKQKDGKRSTMTAGTKTETHHFDTDAWFERDRDEKLGFLKADFDITISEILSSSASSTTATTTEISPPTSPILSPASSTPSFLTFATNSLSVATNYAWGKRHKDGHWHGELQSNATVTAEHIFFL
jgi:hypothetical protein